MVEIYNQEEIYRLDCSHINFLYCSKDLTECTLLLGFLIMYNSIFPLYSAIIRKKSLFL